MQMQQPARYIALLMMLGLCAWLPSEVQSDQATDSSRKINLALRRTADRLLHIIGDSTSRIPAIEQHGVSTWRIHIGPSIGYDSLPFVLQASLDQYHIRNRYEVTIHRCENDVIELGYQQEDFLLDSLVPCGMRQEPSGCHYIEVTFDAGNTTIPVTEDKSWIYVLTFGVVGVSGGAAALWWRRRKLVRQDAAMPINENEWLTFGQSKLNIANQMIEIGNAKHSLTYREAKLLHLFASHPGQLLERDHILQQVWADEGVQVGRSLDMFVSRLRKKLKDDTTIGIVAIHGLGYKLETGIS
jgi:DNA-binding winged helix-turn-helix (wHTH) protein